MFPIPSGRKGRVGRNKGNFTGHSQARGDRRHVLLCHAALEKSVRKFFGEKMGIRGFRKIRAQRHYVFVRFTRDKQTVSKARSSRLLLDVVREDLWIQFDVRIEHLFSELERGEDLVKHILIKFDN